LKEVSVNAWLITWESGPNVQPVDYIAGIVDPRRSDRWVTDLIEFLYLRSVSTLSELAKCAGHRKNVPYRAQSPLFINDVPHGGRVSCRHNPWLYARKVSDLTIDQDPETGLETVVWLEPPQFRRTSDGSFPESVGEPERRTYRRTRIGSVSDGLARS
jgi:hypothetical protein